MTTNTKTPSEKESHPEASQDDNSVAETAHSQELEGDDGVVVVTSPDQVASSDTANAGDSDSSADADEASEKTPDEHGEPSSSSQEAESDASQDVVDASAHSDGDAGVSESSDSDMPVEEETPAVDFNSLDPIHQTHISQLDTMLGGGFPRGATVLIRGESGTGKTVFGLEWLFAGHKHSQESGLYISCSRPVARVQKNAEQFQFFSSSPIEEKKIQFVDFFTLLRECEIPNMRITRDSLPVVLEKLQSLATASGAQRIVMDALPAMASFLSEKDMVPDVLLELAVMFHQLPATVMVTSDEYDDQHSFSNMEELLADATISLRHAVEENRRKTREIQILKISSDSYHMNPTSFEIMDSGVQIFPRSSGELEYKVSDRRISTGISGLDTMTGGYVKGSSILVTGSSGAGKTLSSLQFINAGIQNRERSLYISFEESKPQLLRNAKSFGWDFEDLQHTNFLEFLVMHPQQSALEVHMHRIQEKIDQFMPQRVVIDSLSALKNSFSEETLRDFLFFLNEQLKKRLITTIYTNTSSGIMGAEEISDANVSTMIDTIVMLRYVEVEGELKHALLVLKMRGGSHDKKMRELAFTPHGLEVTSDFSGMEGVLSGNTKKVGRSTDEELYAVFTELLGPMGKKAFVQQKSRGMNMENMTRYISELGQKGIISGEAKQAFLGRVSDIFGSDVRE